MSISRLFGVLLVFFGILISAFTYRYVVAKYVGNSADRLLLAWGADLEILAQSKKLPAGWLNLKEVEYTPLSTAAGKWLETAKPRFPVKSAGQFKLEVMIDDWAIDGKSGAMIQYSLVELTSGNTIWELGRTLEF
jgi:hypothetical protein